MHQYLDLLKKILDQGEEEMDRTGVGTISIHSEAIHFNLKHGFPITTTKFVPIRLPAVELEFFRDGRTDKAWLQEHKCSIWDEWCAPYLLEGKTFASREEKLAFMKEQKDLGPIYGYQWRNWPTENGVGIDQLSQAIEKIKKNPMDRAIIVSAWNVSELHKMALRPCHTMFQFHVRPSGVLDLEWHQRSVDTCLGLPFNIASYALLCHLVARECNLGVGKLTGFLGDVHIYKNHVEQAREQIRRVPLELPNLSFKRWEGFWNWHAEDCELLSYEHHGKIPYEMTAI